MRFDGFGYAALGLLVLAGSAQAGGFTRGTADTDTLYEPGNFALRAGVTYVAPTQEFTSAPTLAPNPGLVGSNYLDNYAIPSAAVKFGFNDSLACAVTYTDAYGAASSHPVPYGPAGKLLEEFTIAEIGTTCAVFFDIGRGRLSVLGGGFIESFDYEVESATLSRLLPPPFPLVPVSTTAELDSRAYGWRAGIGYEIPDIAFRAQLMYRSGTNHDGASGTATITTPLGAGTFPAIGYGELPQMVELKLQSGIAPGWLAFGSVRWTDWSVNETLTLTVPARGVTSVNEYYWRDGWTVTAGVGHAFNESVSGLVSIGWDQGVSTGYDLRGDRWTLAAGGSLKDKIGGELRFGAGISHLAAVDITEGTNVGAAVDSGWAFAVTAGYSVRW
ncbi:outer membrane protein transport protein [Chelativorans sp.]|uniref:OmpP1/FadL family transporter n=1 Tax=Chelativorans sp. TaxID=2203393 RepID=UPI002811727A|nr:outer membrane protein transport protein [Chelativorans sp.]